MRSVAREEHVAAKVQWSIVSLMLVLLLGCAQPPKGTYVQQYKSDFNSRIDISVTHQGIGNASELSVYMSNPRRTPVVLWLVQTYENPGQKVTRESQIYTGEERVLHKIYRLPVGEPDIAGTAIIRVLDNNGAKLLQSAPVTLHSKEKTR